MSDDPIVRLAKLRIIKASADLEVSLATKQGGGIAIEILHRLRVRAAESLAAMAIWEPTKIEGLIQLQNEVKRYDEWLGWIRDIIAEGKQYDQQLTAEDREETLELLSQSQEGIDQAIELGLIDGDPRGD